jgi:hypothetical protein
MNYMRGFKLHGIAGQYRAILIVDKFCVRPRKINLEFLFLGIHSFVLV